jgi:hypothetical protein
LVEIPTAATQKLATIVVSRMAQGGAAHSAQGSASSEISQWFVAQQIKRRGPPPATGKVGGLVEIQIRLSGRCIRKLC